MVSTNSSTNNQQGQMTVLEAINYLDSFFLMYDTWQDAARIASVSRPRRAGQQTNTKEQDSWPSLEGHGVNEHF